MHTNPHSTTSCAGFILPSTFFKWAMRVSLCRTKLHIAAAFKASTAADMLTLAAKLQPALILLRSGALAFGQSCNAALNHGINIAFARLLKQAAGTRLWRRHDSLSVTAATLHAGS